MLLSTFTALVLQGPLMAQTPSGTYGQAPLPLPDGPVRLVIPEAAAFDAALKGGYREFLTGEPREGDPLVAAWRRTQVGTKLEDQWGRLAGDLPWTWEEIRKLQPKAVGLSLLEVGHLEAVLVIETALAQLPVSLPPGQPRTHGGVTYAFVAKGAADASEDKDRRMGLAWARMGGRLLLATSERALKLALDEALAGRGLKAPLPGVVSMELNLEALRADRYFRREFPFPEGPEKGRVRAALRVENGHLVEVREGVHDPRKGVYTFPVGTFTAAGWQAEGEAFWPTFRRACLEPIPALSEEPVAAPAPLPQAGPQAGEDRYAVDFTKPKLTAGGAKSEAGDLAPWKALLDRQPVAHWGYALSTEGARRMVFPWPAALDADFLEACRATVARRAGRATVQKVGDVQEIRVGPGLPALALRRTGELLWVGPSARDLQAVPQPKLEADLIRWAQVDLGAVRAEGARWAKVEGPARPEQVRPLSDRVLGLLGWMPATRSLRVERHRTASGWSETVSFGP
ncbi:MAG TPA: hypothetical protein VJ623_02685 [Holophagaceae bacterium]|nr:hypothetical protein [Holophagaceae bacterium]